jgi:hypothetical protein
MTRRFLPVEVHEDATVKVTDFWGVTTFMFRLNFTEVSDE